MKKNMRFISKNSNLCIVLKHGMPAEPITGRLAVPALYVKFENGVVNVQDEDTQKLMLAHAGFNNDFISAEKDETDPYAHVRKDMEPEHDITEIKHGGIGKNMNPKSSVTISPEQKKVMMDMAKEMASTMAPKLAKDMLEELAKKAKEKEVSLPEVTTLEVKNTTENTTTTENITKPESVPEKVEAEVEKDAVPTVITDKPKTTASTKKTNTSKKNIKK